MSADFFVPGVMHVPMVHIGDRVKVRFGSFGTQLAEVVRFGRRYIYVRKYRAKSGVWTGIVPIDPSTVIEIVP